MKKIILLIMASVLLSGCMLNIFKTSAAGEGKDYKDSHLSSLNPDTINWKAKDKTYWKKVLSPLQYEVTREAGTERAFTGKYWDSKTAGVYVCSNCGQHLFTSKTKYKSGTGWPSFWQAITKSAVTEVDDSKFGMTRTEIICSRCGAHLGHVFSDGPEPTGKRYCMNSVSLILIPDKKE
ncbi:peptide-methionine (R)-S-oxide reductase MsrB [Halobacteriovorax sp. JY17]|uniref:peptide-methionine (R)-S-oxide reductase MsrB n=1 Tax=Halobacteriovorax sp. JY17 TaxID=2014617 RepID=UPI000C4CF66D|nr:peptide-methionine (R)-S-oxide reductase MsrB [Halobacteriovorax sp. JY17]PIK14773.1 MAG: peptide-methionine (R)-S-oxide reductase [Halobacteriovorax sp. JY17]